MCLAVAYFFLNNLVVKVTRTSLSQWPAVGLQPLNTLLALRYESVGGMHNAYVGFTVECLVCVPLVGFSTSYNT